MFRLKSLFGFGVQRVFFAEDNEANAANVNTSKTNSDTRKTDVASSETKKAETHTIKVDGEDVALTLDELKERASKSSGADKRFQEAAAASKAAERGVRIESLVKSISGNDAPSEANIRELAGLLEIEPAEFMEALKEGEPEPKSTSKATTPDFNKQFQDMMGASPAEVRAILEHSQSRHVNDARQEIREISDKAVDKDEIIGKMIVGEDRDDVSLAVKDMVAEDVLRKIQDGKPFGAEMVAASVQRVRAQLTKLGIPKRLNQQPIVLGLGPSAGLSSEIQADEPIKRVPSDEDANEKNLIARYMQKAVKAARSMR